MNTLRAFQGTDTAFDVILSPATVDFATAPALVADVHRGDGRAPLATVTPIWSNTATDLVSVPLPGTALPPGNYILSVRLADDSAYLSWDALVIWPGTSATSPVRSLIPPSECLGVIPELKGDLAQMDALTWLLETATVACEDYCDMALALTDIDRLIRRQDGDWAALELAGMPAYDFQMRTNPDPSIGTDIALYTDVVSATDYYFDSTRGEVRFLRGYSPIVIGRYPHGFLRLTYRAGYAIDPIDVALGVEPAPKALQSACLMVAIAIRESAKTAGPTMQQGVMGQYYTKNINETSVPAPARALLDRYSRQWGVV